jgi:hypothetical protein
MQKSGRGNPNLTMFANEIHPIDGAKTNDVRGKAPDLRHAIRMDGGDMYVGHERPCARRDRGS